MAEPQTTDALPPPEPSEDWRGAARIGWLVILLTFGVLGGWSAVARIDGGVVAPATIVVDSNKQTVQHLEGGIVDELLVRDGSVVRAGDVLLRLDQARIDANVGLHQKQQAILLALEARLLTQRDMKGELVFPREVLEQQADPLVAAAMLDNRRQFDARRSTLAGALDMFTIQTRQTQQEMEQARADRRSSEEQIASIDRELPGLRSLLARGLTPLARVTTLERERAVRVNAREKAITDLARAEERVAELVSRAEQTRREYVQEAANQLPEVRRLLNDVTQQIVLISEQRGRIEVRAPVDGTVQQLRIFTRGGVVRAGEPILDIAPSGGELVVRARVSPVDVDRVRPGLTVEIRMAQFQRYQSAVMSGAVRFISRDVVLDEPTRQSFYLTEVVVDRATIPEPVRDRLVAGMTADVIILTGQRTVLEYLVAPILNSTAFGLRER